MLTPQTLNEQARTMPFEQLMSELAPLISKWSHKPVAGYDQEDVEQEMLEALMLAQRIYDPDKGSFLNLLQRSFSHRIQRLWQKGNRHTRAITEVTCPACGTPQPRNRWGPGDRCGECGSRKLNTTRQTVLSLDRVMDHDDQVHGAGWEPNMEEIGYELVEVADQFHALPKSRQQQIIEEVTQ